MYNYIAVIGALGYHEYPLGPGTGRSHLSAISSVSTVWMVRFKHRFSTLGQNGSGHLIFRGISPAKIKSWCYSSHSRFCAPPPQP